jgi:hypothetical protein
MRIRQVRPEFFSDPVTSKLPPDVRLTYIGLWCVADDAGWLSWDVPNIGALLYPYESVRVRERRLDKAGDALEAAGRIVKHECGCVLIPRLEAHQRIGGNKTVVNLTKHRVHTRLDESSRNVTLSNGTLNAPARDPDGREGGPWDEKVAATLARDRS